MSYVFAAIAAVGAAKAISGGIKKSKAKKMAARNKRPVYKINQPILDNQNLLESRVSGSGVSDATRQMYETENQRGYTTAMGTILRGGGSVNNIADLYSNSMGSGSGISQLALLAEKARAENVQLMINQNNILSGEQDKEYQINKYAPYADKAQASKELSAQGSQQIWQGVDMIGSAVGGFAGAKKTKNDENTASLKTDYSKPVSLMSSAPTQTPSSLTVPQSVSGFKSTAQLSPQQIQAMNNMTDEQKAEAWQAIQNIINKGRTF